jgi:hypothetical protein
MAVLQIVEGMEINPVSLDFREVTDIIQFLKNMGERKKV